MSSYNGFRTKEAHSRLAIFTKSQSEFSKVQFIGKKIMNLFERNPFLNDIEFDEEMSLLTESQPRFCNVRNSILC